VYVQIGDLIETKQGIEGKIDRFRWGKVRVREPINFGAC